MNKATLLQIIKKEVVPSLGVTEPGAVSMCCAAASDNNSIDAQEVKVIVSPNIYKNCMAVGIPGFGEKGIVAAAALGAVGGDYTLELEALSNITKENLEACAKLINENKVRVEISDNGELLYIEAFCKGKNGNGHCIIQGSHSNITLIEKNGEAKFSKEYASDEEKDISHELLGVKVRDILCAIEEMTIEELNFLQKGADMNMKASLWGLEHKPGMALGASLLSMKEKGLIPESLTTDLQIHTAAASDVRVSGSFVPVMTCAGSGNHGITAIIPVVRAAELLGSTKEKELKALAISTMITVYVKNYSGKLSGMCGCSVASATGVAAALTYLYGGTAGQIEGSIKNMAGDITGMICDGAKDGCSLKLSTAVASAVKAATLAVSSVIIPDDNGIIGDTCEKTMMNMGKVSAVGMYSTDKVILEIMQNCK